MRAAIRRKTRTGEGRSRGPTFPDHWRSGGRRRSRYAAAGEWRVVQLRRLQTSMSFSGLQPALLISACHSRLTDEILRPTIDDYSACHGRVQVAAIAE